jgi:hypothetical protein
MKSRSLKILSVVLLCVVGWSPLLQAVCTGTSDCRACSKCTSCKHCGKEGGTCGVKSRLQSKTPPNALDKPEQQSEATTPLAAVRNEADYLLALTSLCDPVKLSTLGDRGANPRLKKIVYWLDCARHSGKTADEIIDLVLQKDGYTKGHRVLIKTNLLRNIKIGDALGFFTPDNLTLLRTGAAPYVMNGPYRGERADVDHIIPFSVAPEIGNDIANLELMPTNLNLRKGAKVGQRQKTLAHDLHAAGVLDIQALDRILRVRTSGDEVLVLAGDETRE